jgi:putative aldouronate transport system substrate-binding protein
MSKGRYSYIDWSIAINLIMGSGNKYERLRENINLEWRKRMRKRIVRYGALMFAGSLTVLSLAACGGRTSTANSGKTAESTNLPVDESGNPSALGKYKEPVTVEIVQSINPTQSFPAGQTVEDNQYTKYVKEVMNIDIKIKWQAANGDDYTQKQNLAIASNDLPDIMRVGQTQFKELADSDLIEDLTDVYAKYASDTMKYVLDTTKGEAIETATMDGKLYGLPGVTPEADSYNLMWIRQDWLDKLGLEVPETVEDLQKVAQAFVDNKMGGEQTVGILGASANNNLYNNFLSPANNLLTFDAIFSAYKAWPGFWIEDTNGDPIYGSITPETKETLAKLQEMYKSGALDQELGARKDADEAWKSGKAGILFTPWWQGYSIKDALVNDPEASWIAYALPLAEDGKWYPKMANSTSTFLVVRKGYEHPEAAVLLNNYLLRDEATFDTTAVDPQYYPGRVVMSPADENAYTVTQLKKVLNGEAPDDYDKTIYKNLTKDLDSLKNVKLEPYDDLRIATWNRDDDNFGRIYSMLCGSARVNEADEAGNIERVYSKIYNQTTTMEKKWANLKKLEDETFLKIIIGESSVDEFDKFVEQWKAEGGDEITKEVKEYAAK